MVFLDLLHLTSLNFSCVVALSQDRPTMTLADNLALTVLYRPHWRVNHKQTSVEIKALF